MISSLSWSFRDQNIGSCWISLIPPPAVHNPRRNADNVITSRYTFLLWGQSAWSGTNQGEACSIYFKTYEAIQTRLRVYRKRTSMHSMSIRATTPSTRGSHMIIVTDDAAIREVICSAASIPYSLRIGKFQMLLVPCMNEIEVFYCPGKDHTNVDPLSRAWWIANEDEIGGLENKSVAQVFAHFMSTFEDGKVGTPTIEVVDM